MSKKEKWNKFVRDFASEVAIEFNSDVSQDIGSNLIKKNYFADIAERLLHESGLYVNEAQE